MARRKRGKQRGEDTLFKDYEAVLLEDIDISLDDRSTGTRLDGPSPKSNTSGSNSTRDTTGPRLSMSILELLELLASFGPLWQLCDQVEALIDATHIPRKGGRNREYRVIEALLFGVAVWHYHSYTAAHDNLTDPKNWQRLCSAVEQAWPDHPEWRLSSTPISRSQQFRFRKRYSDYAKNHLLVVLRRLISDACVQAALCMGMFDSEIGDSLACPDRRNVITGDATWIRGAYNKMGPAIDPRTGKVKRFCPDSRLYHTNDGALSSAPGQQVVFIEGRNPFPNEHVMLDVCVMPPKRPSDPMSDATMAVDMTLDLIDRHPLLDAGVRCFAYDMALRSRDKDRLLDSGRIYASKSPLTSQNKRASCNLGDALFRCKNGTQTYQQLAGIADTPCVFITDGNGKIAIQPLRRVTLERKPRKNRWVIYGIWAVPDKPLVPPHLVGATTRILHNSTPEERHRSPHRRRTRALSPLPASDPHFRAVHGIRQDPESINSNIKDLLRNRRCRTPGAGNLTFEMLTYQLYVLIKALAAYCKRTGANTTQWFGQFRMPVRAGPLPKAA